MFLNDLLILYLKLQTPVSLNIKFCVLLSPLINRFYLKYKVSVIKTLYKIIL